MDFLFDLDGTLIDSSPSILGTFAAILKQAAISPRVALDSGLIGPPLRATLARITGIEDPTRIEQLADAFKATYDTTGYRETIPYTGVDNALRELNAREAQLWIVTNKRIAPTMRIMDMLRWTDLFSGIFALDAFDPPEGSKRDMVARVIRERNIDPGTAVMIGDTAEDAAAAQANGLRFVGASWGYGHLGAPHDLLAQPEQIARLLSTHSSGRH
jgi:phosphoglycolate phosphatase